MIIIIYVHSLSPDSTSITPKCLDQLQKKNQILYSFKLRHATFLIQTLSLTNHSVSSLYYTLPHVSILYLSLSVFLLTKSSSLYLSICSSCLFCLCYARIKYNNTNQHCPLSAVPSCSLLQRESRLSVMLQETLELTCAMTANPRSNMEFKWTLNTTKDQTDIPRSQFSEHGLKSILTYTALTKMDYGTISCIANNEVGETIQGRECVFQILPAGRWSESVVRTVCVCLWFCIALIKILYLCLCVLIWGLHFKKAWLELCPHKWALIFQLHCPAGWLQTPCMIIYCPSIYT